MPIGSAPNFLTGESILLVLKIAILIILALYAIFALIIVRQVDLMSKTLLTHISPIVKAFAIIHAGFVIGLIILAWGIL